MDARSKDHHCGGQVFLLGQFVEGVFRGELDDFSDGDRLSQLALSGDFCVVYGDLVEYQEQVRVQVVVVEGETVHVVWELFDGQRRQVVFDQGVERLFDGYRSVDEDQFVLFDELRQGDELPLGGVNSRELGVEGRFRVGTRHSV